MKAAAQGSPHAETGIGCLYHFEGDDTKALDWFKKAVDQGYGKAANDIALLLYDGNDDGKAFEWYKKAADLGDVSAASSVGNFYFRGIFVPQDFQTARDWYKKAADQGDVVAQAKVIQIADATTLPIVMNKMGAQPSATSLSPTVGQQVSITLQNGTVKSGKLITIDADGISLLTDDGGGKTLFTDLSKPDQVRFGYDTQTYFTNGSDKIDDKDWDGAIADFDMAIRIVPQNAAAYYLRGDAKEEKQDWNGAIADYSKVIDFVPNVAYQFSRRGDAESKKENWDAAALDYDKAVELDSEYSFTYIGRAYARANKGDLNGAIADYTKAIEREPDAEYLYATRGLEELENGVPAAAITDYTKAIQLSPNDGVAYDNRGVAETALNDVDGAITDFTKAIEINPRDDFAYRHRAVAEMVKGNNGSANDDIARAGQIAGASPTPDGGVGTALGSSSPPVTESQDTTTSTPGAWHPVASFSGSSDKNTEPFIIHFDRWRVRWSSKATTEVTSLENKVPGLEGAVGFYATAVSDDTPKQDDQNIVSKQGPGSDSTELRGAGTWSLHVIASSSNWTAVIEEYAPTSP